MRCIDAAGKCKKPADPAAYTASVVAQLAEAKKGLDALCGPKAPLPFPDLAKGCQEGGAAFLWPVMATAPADTCQNGVESSEFYHNKLRKWGKDNSKPEFGVFANAYRDVLKAMGEWAKENAKMGLAWNAKGGDTKDFKPVGGAAAPAAASAAAPAAASAAAPAAAAVAPPAAAAAAAAAAASPVAKAASGGGGGAALGALFSQISSIDQSHGKTEGLRHVTKDMKASALKAAGGDASPVVVAPKAAAGASPRAAAAGGLNVKLGEPKTAAEGQRWEVQFHTKETTKGEVVRVDGAQLKQEVYIYGCSNCTIDISTKVKGVRIDSCDRVVVFMNAALSGVEVVNSRRMKIQVREKLPSVAIDKTDGILVGLTWPARDAVITSSKSSEMNVTYPVSEAADADWVESPIPEQFVSSIGADGKVHTKVSELYTS